MSEEKAIDAAKFIKLAESAISTENYAKAKRMLIKSDRLHPSDRAKQLLKHIQSLEQDNNNVDDNAEITAEKCVTIARIAMATKNVEKAERFLRDSIKFHPLEEAKELMEEIEKIKIKEENTKQLVEKAKIAFTNKNYDEALKVLDEIELDTEQDDITELKKIFFSAKEGNDVSNHEVLDLFDTLMLKDEDIDLESGTLEDAEVLIMEAEKCMQEFEYKKAARILKKAVKAFPTDRAIELLKEVEKKLIDLGEVLEEEEEEVEVRKRDITEEQISKIRRVLQADDDHDILGVPSGSSWNDIKKAYKNLTKVLHPDKNRAPGAREAYMKLRDAAARLQP